MFRRTLPSGWVPATGQVGLLVRWCFLQFIGFGLIDQRELERRPEAGEVARGNGASEIVSLRGGNLGEKIKNPNEIDTQESQRRVLGARGIGGHQGPQDGAGDCGRKPRPSHPVRWTPEFGPGAKL